ncbi:hypothetical protein AURDEDRAFT_144839 [Auricularia subglabra TFB-10046 SS5]|nr:hypothetical protein AURDEDRAFT_144839 [Auricularia subglabra TFB-10046 SS5]
MTRGKPANAAEPDPHFRRQHFEWPWPHPAPYTGEGCGRLRWRPNVDYCVNGTGWAHGTYLEALDPVSRYRSICIPCRIWKREPLLGLPEQRKAQWRACHNPDGSMRPLEEAAERLKGLSELGPTSTCSTCGQQWTIVDARFEAPSKGKPEKEWRKRYAAWLNRPGARQLQAHWLKTS